MDSPAYIPILPQHMFSKEMGEVKVDRHIGTEPENPLYYTF